MTLKTPDVLERNQLQEEEKNSETEAAPQGAPNETEAAPQGAPNETQSAPQGPAARKPSVWKDLLLLLIKIASIVLLLLILTTFLFGVTRYQDPSMSPAIKNGDLVIFYRHSKAGYLPQDVIVLDFNGQCHARRVVAAAGDKVDITDAGLLVNGALQQESEIYQQTERYQEGVSFPLTVPEGQVFVLGDSRTGAADSRIYGCVQIEDTLGKVMTIIRRRGI